MIDLSTKALKHIRDLAQKATPGPWAYESHGDTEGYGVGVILDENDKEISGLNTTTTLFILEAVAPEVSRSTNAAYIAANYPGITIAIIEEIFRLRAELERMEQEADCLAGEVNPCCSFACPDTRIDKQKAPASLTPEVSEKKDGKP